MRPIEFRAWCKKHKEMTDVDLYETFSHQGFECENGDYHDNFELATDKFILMQFTGLKDKKGIKIFEGDIVEVFEGEPVSMGNIQLISGVEGNLHIVQWHELTWCISEVGVKKDDIGYGLRLSAYGSSKYGEDLSDGMKADCIEIVGNIFENKELLEIK